MKIEDVRTFVAVAEQGSIQRAAKALGLTQPAVTRQIQRLEAGLGVPLLDRRTKPPGLTIAGSRVLPACRRMLKAAQDLKALAGGGEEPSGSLSIGIAQGVEDIALGAPLDALRARFPKLGVRIATHPSAGLLEQAAAARFDIAVVLLPYGASPPAALGGHLLGRDPLTVLAPASWALEPGLSAKRLGEYGWVLNAEGCGHRTALTKAVEAADATLAVNAEAFDMAVQLSLVSRGTGLGLAAPRVVAASPDREKLKPVLLEDGELAVGVWLIADQPGDAMRPVIECFEAALSAALHAAPERTAA